MNRVYIPQKKENKYHAKKVKEDGVVYASKKEHRRYCELKMLERAGKISNLRTQVKYELIPSQWEEIETDEVYVRGSKTGQKKKKKKCVEQGVSYIADFVYCEGDKEIVEDAKGMRPSDYVIKRKLMLYILGIKVVEV